MDKKLILLVSMIQLIAFSSFANPTSIDFIRGSLLDVQQRANAEGKLYFVDFTAAWCSPCQWMDQTTFSNRELVEYVNANYLAVKVDIDDFDGFVYKEKFEIKVLPTILIFNAKGEMVERYEETLPPSRMLEILAQHNTYRNRTGTNAHNFGNAQIMSTSKPTPIGVDPQGFQEVHSNYPAPGFAMAESTQETVMDAPIINIPSEYSSTYSAPVRNEMINAPEFKISRPVTHTSQYDSDLYRFNVEQEAATGFSVQVGAYSQYGNVLREVAKFQSMTDQPVLVKINERGDKTIYKVLIGTFQYAEWAQSLKSELKSAGIDAFVKNLEEL